MTDYKNKTRDRDDHFTWYLVVMGLSIVANILSNLGTGLIA